MKKYIIKDSFGNIKIIYANNLSHAFKVYDSIIAYPGGKYLGMVYINGRPMYIRHGQFFGCPEFWGISPDKWCENPRKKFYSEADLEKYLKSVGATSGSKNPGLWGDAMKDSCIVKVDNEYIMQSNRPEMTSLKKYAKIFSSEQEARDYARKYFRLKSSDIEIIRG